jgi:hypothetical protein
MKISPDVVHTIAGNIRLGGKPENACDGCERPFSKMAAMIFTYIMKLVENVIQSPLLKYFTTFWKMASHRHQRHFLVYLPG